MFIDSVTMFKLDVLVVIMCIYVNKNQKKKIQLKFLKEINF